MHQICCPLSGAPWNALGQIDAPAALAMQCTEVRDSNEKSIPYPILVSASSSGTKEIQNAGVLQHPVKKKRSESEGSLSFRKSVFLTAGSKENLISCPRITCRSSSSRHPVRSKSNVCRSLLITDLRTPNAWCLFNTCSILFLTVNARHTRQCKVFSADIHVIRTLLA